MLLLVIKEDVSDKIESDEQEKIQRMNLRKTNILLPTMLRNLNIIVSQKPEKIFQPVTATQAGP